MRMYIVNKEGELITHFEQESNPFKVGETIDIQITNEDKSFWLTEEIKGSFIVKKIEHFLEKRYTKNKQVVTVFTVSVQVSPLQ